MFRPEDQVLEDLGAMGLLLADCQNCKRPEMAFTEPQLIHALYKHARVCLKQHIKLPDKDQHTSYDYKLGERRRAAIGTLNLKVCCTRDQPIVINGDLPRIQEYTELHSKPHTPYLVGTLYFEDTKEYEFVHIRQLDMAHVLEFAQKSVDKYGVIDAEKVLSSTDTGSLYYQMIHNFHDFGNCCSMLSDVR